MYEHFDQIVIRLNTGKIELLSDMVGKIVYVMPWPGHRYQTVRVPLETYVQNLIDVYHITPGVHVIGTAYGTISGRAYTEFDVRGRKVGLLAYDRKDVSGAPDDEWVQRWYLTLDEPFEPDEKWKNALFDVLSEPENGGLNILTIESDYSPTGRMFSTAHVKVTGERVLVVNRFQRDV